MSFRDSAGRAIRFHFVPILILVAACNAPGKTSGGGSRAGAPGEEETGGSGPSATGGKTGSTGGKTGSTGGAPGTGGAVSTGGSGSSADAAPAVDGPAGPDGGTPAGDSGPVSAGKCNATPGASAGMLKLAMKPIAITPAGSIDAVGPGKSATGLTEIRFVPGSANEFFVSQKAARLNHFRLEGNNAVLVRRFTVPAVFAEEDCGLISFAFDPDYQTNKYVYAAFCTTANKSKVVRYTVGETLTDPVDILDFSEPSNTSAFHSIGSIGFDRDKNMWLLHGEFYNAANAQNLSSTMGKLLRFVPGKTGGATPAAGNPFAGMAGKSPLIYAYGFRSPWRGFADSKGRFLVGDVGPGTAEELNLVTMPGQNFGWNGTRAGNVAGPGLTTPISTYRIPNDPYEGDGNPVWESRPRRSVWVGVQYEDCGNDKYGGAMTGVYLFGDLFAGWVRGAVIDDTGKKTVDTNLANVSGLSAWAQGPDGYLYALKFGNYGDHLTGEQIGILRAERAP
jgi:hypothetical protein